MGGGEGRSNEFGACVGRQVKIHCKGRESKGLRAAGTVLMVYP